MKKKLSAVLAATIAFCLLLAGCGGGGSSAPATSGSNDQAASSAGDAAGAAPSGDVITIKVAHVSQEGVPIDQAMRRLADMLDEHSGGQLQLEVYAASALGGNRELLEQLQLGSLEMCISSVAFLGGFTDSTGLLDLPYLFENNAAAEEVLDGEVGTAIFDELRSSGFIGLAWLDTGWRHLTANDEIRTPAQMSGKKIRVMENQMHIDHFNALGASAIPMAFSEVYTALQNGTIDCQENPYANIQGNRLNEVQTYIIETGHIYDTSPLLASEIFWDKLTQEQQDIITECVAEVLAWEREVSLTDQDETRVAFQNNGTNVVVQLTSEERAAFRDAAAPVYEKYGDIIGYDLISMVEEINQKHA